ncbi:MULTISPECIES: TlpA disulfide reductase family protein [Butyricimonas]|uniref:TlpA disulfide reductase family protein n=1 Tax=Butyricimonas TaxID=574697 RepID=UPI0020825D47|nr:TlpA disulfide reductase family protein [Butyricimonas paravirosa]BDF54743.1 thiol:disulfide interchange protein [Odoribacteraceae bacterium]GKH93605.1 thiol:disulfide interchange protein [Odoribacteraceae bacterium]GKH99509.1 thiol:disulfide interchange protein [Odoribacteraceae bacterium]GKI02975.1 thiol:disulfide interchange protein [Odoribacteraceae bacterium]
MKRLLYGIVCLGTLVACQREPGYKISGSVPGTPDGMKVYLYNWNTPVDSSVVKGGKFILTGKVDVPTRYQLLIDLSPDKVESYEKDLRGSDVFVDNVDIKYESPSIDSLPSRNSFRRKVKGNVTVTGSPVHDLFLSYQEKLKPYRTRNSEAWDKYLQVYHIPASEGVFNTREGIALTREMNDAQKEITRIQWDFIKANPKSPVSVDVAQNMVYTAKFSKADMDNLLQAIDTSLRETPGYKQLKESLESMAPIALGEKYRDLELVDENGKTVHLSDYVKPGQYNMVEFWASWCGPCRGEIPHLRHVYDAYGKGKDAFNMISVSIDDKEKDWKQALKEENMKWTQLCDLKGWKGEVINKYKIQGVPFCLILDKEGRIIDHGVRGSELDVVLIKYLGDRYEE